MNRPINTFVPGNCNFTETPPTSLEGFGLVSLSFTNLSLFIVWESDRNLCVTAHFPGNFRRIEHLIRRGTLFCIYPQCKDVGRG